MENILAFLNEWLGVIVSVGAAVALIIAFFWGVLRGGRVEIGKLIVIVVAFGFCLLTTNAITEFILVQDFSKIGFIKGLLPANVSTLQELISHLIKTLLVEGADAPVLLIEMIFKIFVVIGNFFIFTAMFWFLVWLGFFINAIVSHNIEYAAKRKKWEELRRKALLENVEFTTTKKEVFAKSNKKRLLGGIIGLVNGAILVFMTLFPLTAITSMTNDVQIALNAEHNKENSIVVGKNEFQDFLVFGDSVISIPTEASSILSQFNSSILSQTLGLGNADVWMLDVVSATTINGEVVHISKALYAMIDLLPKMQSLLSFNIENIESMNIAEIKELVETIFSSNLIADAFSDVLTSSKSTILESFPQTTEKEIALHNFVECAIDSLNAKTLKQFLFGVLDSAEIVIDAGVSANDLSIQELTSKLSISQFETVVTNITNTDLVAKIFPSFVDLGMTYLEEIIGEEIEELKGDSTLLAKDFGEDVVAAIKTFSSNDVLKTIISGEEFNIVDLIGNNNMQETGKAIDEVLGNEVLKNVLDAFKTKFEKAGSFASIVDLSRIDLDNYSFENLGKNINEVMDLLKENRDENNVTFFEKLSTAFSEDATNEEKENALVGFDSLILSDDASSKTIAMVLEEVMENAKIDGILADTYSSMINSMKENDSIKKVIESYGSEFEIKWVELIDLARAGNKIATGGELSTEDLSNIVDLAASNSAIKDSIIDSIENVVKETSLSGVATEVADAMKNLDFADETTKDEIKNLISIKDKVEKITDSSSSTEITKDEIKEITTAITDSTIIKNALENVAEENVPVISDFSANDEMKVAIQDVLDADETLTAAEIAKIKNLFNI